MVFRDRRDLSLVTVSVRPAKQAAARKALEAAGFGLPAVGTAAQATSPQADDAWVIWSALDRWTVLAPRGPGDLYKTLAEAVGDTAALVDQSSGLSAIGIGGPRVDALLAKGTPIDLHALTPGRTAATGIDHQPVTLWRTEADRVLLLVGRSFAQDTLEFLQEMALEFGYRNG